jgi:hypothetical protein
VKDLTRKVLGLQLQTGSPLVAIDRFLFHLLPQTQLDPPKTQTN